MICLISISNVLLLFENLKKKKMKSEKIVLYVLRDSFTDKGILKIVKNFMRILILNYFFKIRNR